MTPIDMTMSEKVENKYDPDDTINDLMRWVRHTKLEKDAIWNAKQILKEYEQKKTFKQKLKALFF